MTAILLSALLAGQFRLVGVAAEANAPSLVISQLKMTSSNGQFITLYNPTNTPLDMGKYQLEYFNNYDLAKATSSKLISLTGLVPPHGYFMVSDSSQMLCYQLTVDSVSLGLSSTAGMVEVLAYNQSAAGSSATPVLQDFVGWSKTAASGAQTLPSNTSAFLQRQPADSSNNPVVTIPGSGSWQAVQPNATDACSLVTSGSSSPVITGLSQLLTPTEPPATFINQLNDTPATYDGQMAPLVTEILPNPIGTGNDAVDEFIEVYNPNVADFDFSDFSLRVGTTTLHDFKIPSGTILPAQSFTTFYAGTTHLSLSNSGGQVRLLDPTGITLGSTEVYGTAKDGQAWALANGKWYWTTQPTPGEPNVIDAPPASAAKAKPKTSSGKSSAKKSTSTKSKSAKAPKSKKAKKPKTTAKLASSTTPAPAPSTPIHSSTLVVIAGLALLYGAYEYRADLANRFHQLRRHLKIGRNDRPQV